VPGVGPPLGGGCGLETLEETHDWCSRVATISIPHGEEANGSRERAPDDFSFVIPGWSEGPDPESRDSQMRNCAS
jgi:hypothetical protein